MDPITYSGPTEPVRVYSLSKFGKGKRGTLKGHHMEARNVNFRSMEIPALERAIPDTKIGAVLPPYEVGGTVAFADVAAKGSR